MAKGTGLMLGLAGVVAFALSRKKKRKKAAPIVEDEIYDWGKDVTTPDTKPKKKTSKRPSGNPPCEGPPAPGVAGACYDRDYWGDSTLNRMTNIRQHFADLGYPIKVGPWPVNKIGPKGEFEVTNEDGTTGKLGGNDDKPDMTVMRFQNEYNAVSRCKELSGLTGGLAPDGLVGYHVLAALRVAKETLGAKNWEDVLRTCSTKGFTP